MTGEHGPGEPGPLSGVASEQALHHAAQQIQDLVRTQGRMNSLLEAVLALSQDLELSAVLHRVVTTAMDLVGARYGALGVLHEQGSGLSQFIPVGLSQEEIEHLAGVEHPTGQGLLGRMIHQREPLRIQDIGAHPDSAGFPPGHPPMRTLLGVAISVRGRVYGNLYLSTRHDGLPFDVQDEEVVTALAGAAGVAIENARLFEEVRSGAERFQRLLLPRLTDLGPFDVAAVYRPASEGRHHLGGDWYDALMLPDGACAAVIGDVVGHDLVAAAAMSQTRSMLRALLYDRGTPASKVLAQLDHTLHAITENPVTTACLARIEPADRGWDLCWSTAGHPPPLLLAPGSEPRYLEAEPGLPLGVDVAFDRPDHRCALSVSTTVVLYTDGLVEHPRHSLDRGMDALAEVAAKHAEGSLAELCEALVANAPGDGHDDVAVLALRTPAVLPVV
ncbi:PP2C family protein-serine/threonine phosphatase [Nocardiopsis valliformis]|uniref:PP2C family protein-serine/threonine phosphatase n=1 Tax=Nocardiopsis valliformis TaxID=239974 RepID=UPI00034B906B|nr:GAF domain-containing SpoIIE family protein phosphatase [Nocardiopsis valliformis]